MQIVNLYRRGSVILTARNGGLLCPRSMSTCTDSNEYVEKPNYPPILELSAEAVEAREKQAWHDKITNLGTYEQKLVELNMPKAHGYWSCILDAQDYHVNALPFLKFITRTSVTEGLPEQYYSEVKDPASVAAERLAPHVEQLISLHYRSKINRTSEQKRNIHQQDFLRGLHRLLSTCLPRPTHARCVQQPRVTAWWLAGGLQNVGLDRQEWRHLPEDVRERRLMARNLFMDREEPFMGDMCFSSHCAPLLSVRERHGLPQVEERILNGTEVTVRSEVEKQGAEEKDERPDDSRLHPEVYGYEFRHVPAVLMPGYYPGEAMRHGRVFYHSNHHVKQVEAREGGPECGAALQQLLVAVHTQGLAQAGIFGFSPVSELTYPIVQQSVLTSGRSWRLALHQLNTIALHSHNTVSNHATNRLWVSAEEQLWENVENGAVQGLNLLLLARLATLYMKETRLREDETPYLAPYKYLWNHPAIPRYRKLFHKMSQKLSSGQLWIDEKPELHAWEKIYKLDHQTMHHWKNNKRFYEGKVLLPQDRTMKQYLPESIRVYDRPLGKKDPLKRDPLIDSEKLFVTRYERFKPTKFGYEPRYMAHKKFD